MNTIQLLRAPLFADRGTDIQQAIDDAYAMINAIKGSDRISALVALHIVTNTVANALEENAT